MKSVWAIILALVLMVVSLGQTRDTEYLEDYLQPHRPKKTQSSSYIRFGKRANHPHLNLNKKNQLELLDLLQVCIHYIFRKYISTFKFESSKLRFFSGEFLGQ